MFEEADDNDDDVIKSKPHPWFNIHSTSQTYRFQNAFWTSAPYRSGEGYDNMIYTNNNMTSKQKASVFTLLWHDVSRATLTCNITW